MHVFGRGEEKKKRKCVVDGGMHGGGGRGWGRNQRRNLKKENEVVHYRLWSPPLPLSAHYFSYLRRKDISLFFGGGVYVCVRVQRGDRLGVGLL